MHKHAFKAWCAGDFYHPEHLEKHPLIMGVLNLTPDSFSDGGCFLKLDDALFHAEKLIKEGADLLDIGGVSSRPFASPVSVQEELDRVLPFLERISEESDICISVDTSEPQVMQEALSLGCGALNDIRAFQNPKALEVLQNRDVPLIVMHMQGEPESMQVSPTYSDGVIKEIDHFFHRILANFEKAGILKERIVLDPGFGFGKTVSHNLELVRNLGEFCYHRRPILLGVSRKHTLGVLLNEPPNKRLSGSLALSVLAVERGAVILRTHDVHATRQAISVAYSMLHEY